jgi:hypothetical protein
MSLLAEYRNGARIDFLPTKYGVHRSYPRQLFKRYAQRLPSAKEKSRRQHQKRGWSGPRDRFDAVEPVL